MYEPYDYVVSSSGILGSFRAYTESGNIAFRPVYQCSAGRWTKLTSRAAASLPGRRHLLLDRDCVLVREEEVTPLVSWRSPETGAAEPSTNELPAALRDLLSELRSRGVRVYLYGSRLLGRWSRDSDWDFIVDHRGDLVELLRSCRGRPGRLLDPREISSIAAFYEGNTIGSAGREDILLVLSKSWCTLRVAGAVVDFFLAGDESRRIPDVRLSDVPLTDCEGVIEPSSGSSFHMPRRVRIHTSTGQTVNLNHASWILCGLERMAGSRVTLRDVFVHGPSDVWLSPWISKFSFAA